MVQDDRGFVPTALRQALQEYLERRQVSRAVSITEMSKRVRYAFPDLALTDRELEQVIAEEVIGKRGSLAFDRCTDSGKLSGDSGLKTGH